MKTRRTFLGMLFAASLLLGPWLLVATPAAACSCGPFTMADAAAEPSYAVFTGVPGEPGARGVPVRVTRWFAGPGAGPIVWLAARGFGDGAGCGASVPPPGGEWIFIGWVERPGADPALGLCQPSGPLAEEGGRQLLAEAIATFGSGPIEDPPAPPSVPVSPPSPAPTPPTDGGPSLAIVVALAVLAIATPLVVAMLVRRGRRGSA